jgi:hypothetical protein
VVTVTFKEPIGGSCHWNYKAEWLAAYTEEPKVETVVCKEEPNPELDPFPVGSKVKVVDKAQQSDSSCFWHDALKATLGQVGTVRHSIPNKNIEVEFTKGIGTWWMSRNWVTPYEEPKPEPVVVKEEPVKSEPTLAELFPIGSKVKLADKRPVQVSKDDPAWIPHMEKLCGQVGTVVATGAKIISANFVVGLATECYALSPAWFTAYKEPTTIKPEPTLEECFPTGSKVKVVDKKPDDHRNGPGWNIQHMDRTLGQVGTVTGVVKTASNSYVMVAFDCLPASTRTWGYKESWITPYKDEPVVKEPTLLEKFPVGSKVKIMDGPPSADSWWMSSMDQTCGQTGYVREVYVRPDAGDYVNVALTIGGRSYSYRPTWLKLVKDEPKKKLSMLELRQKYLGGVKGNEPHDVNQAIKGDDSRSMKFTTVADGDVYLTENEFAKLGKPPYLSLTPLNHEEWVYWVSDPRR